jgi:hypothetical protein
VFELDSRMLSVDILKAERVQERERARESERERESERVQESSRETDYRLSDCVRESCSSLQQGQKLMPNGLESESDATDSEVSLKLTKHMM